MAAAELVFHFTDYPPARLSPSGWVNKPDALAEPALAGALQFLEEWLEGRTDFVLHTSGSTGAPKPILAKRAAMEASARRTARAIGLQAGWHALVALDTGMVAGRMMLVRSLVTGMHTYLATPSANPLLCFPDVRLDFAAFVPLQVQAILDTPITRHRFANMKAVLIGGAALALPLEEELARLGGPVRIWHTYGMTETLSHIALRELTSGQSFYQALPGVELATDERGCLQVKADVTDNKWLTTNDLVELLPNNRFNWLGRADLVINSGGVKVQVEKVEQQAQMLLSKLANLHPPVVVCPLPDERLGQKVALVMGLAAVEQGLLTALRAGLSDRLPKYHLPTAWLLCPEFPLTTSGKPDRQQIGRLAAEGRLVSA